MLCDWGVGYRVRVSASVDGYAIIVRGEYVIWDMKDWSAVQKYNILDVENII